MDTCVFCSSSFPMSPSDEFVVYRGPFVAASHIVNPEGKSYLGHLVVQSTRHARGFAELADGEAEATGLTIARVSRAVKRCTEAENVYAVFFAEVVPHLHVLLTARYPDTPEQYWRMGVFDWPSAPRGDLSQVRQLCEDMREVIAAE